MKKSAFLLIALGSCFTGLAQETSPAENAGVSLLDDPLLPVYQIGLFMLIVLFLVVLVARQVLRVLNLLTEKAARENAAKAGIPYVPAPGWWSRLTHRLNASVPVEQEKEIELDHSYDGIRELDNHLPPWWKWLFYATIGWAAIYLVVFHVSAVLPLSGEEYEQEVAQASEAARRLEALQPKAAVDLESLQFSPDAAIIEKGKAVFTNFNCGSCHRNDGGGNTIGPNLTDQFWLHGGSVKEIYSTIRDGVVEKGMPAWGKSMSPADVRDVTFFVMSLQGTNPPDAKASQGDLVMPSMPAADTVKAQASI